MTVIITRPEPDASAFAQHLTASNIPFIHSPVMEIIFEPIIPNLKNVSALAFTSANGVRALMHALTSKGSSLMGTEDSENNKTPTKPILELPVYAIGPATAKAAKHYGFSTIHTASGDGVALATLIINQLKTDHSKPSRTNNTNIDHGHLVYHCAGSIRQGDLVRRLEQASIKARREVLYRAEPIESLSQPAQNLLKNRQPPNQIGSQKKADADSPIDIAFFSPRSVSLFMSQIEKAGLTASLAYTNCVCLSEAIAAKLDKKQWKSIQIAAKPDIQAIHDLLTP